MEQNKNFMFPEILNELNNLLEKNKQEYNNKEILFNEEKKSK